MKILVKTDITTDSGTEVYKTYFYHKFNKFVYEITHNNNECPASLRKTEKINKDMRFSDKLPKYILANLPAKPH